MKKKHYTPSPSKAPVAPNDKTVKQILMNMIASNQLLQDSLKDMEMPDFTKTASPQVMGMNGEMVSSADVAASVKFEGTNQMAMDSTPINNVGGGLNGFNNQYFARVNSLLIDNVFLGYAEYSLLLQNGILNAICDVPATEMTSKWIEFVSVTDGDKTDKIKELELEGERLNVKDIFYRGAYFSLAMGGCLVYPEINDASESDEVQQPLYLDKITKGSLKYLTLIEPIWYVPIRYVTDKPLSKWFYKPEYWTVMGKIVHESRVFHFMHNEAPNILKPQYNFNGMPLMGQSIKGVMHFETMQNTILEIVQSLNLRILKTGLQAIAEGAAVQDPSMNAKAGQSLGTRLRALASSQSNLNIMAIDMDNEEMQNLTMQLTGLDKLWSQSAEFMCIVPRLSATELLGLSPQGFNSGGHYEKKRFNRYIKSLQEKMFRANMVKLMHMMMLNLWGKIDDGISFEFCNLEEANELEESQIAVNEMTEATGYVDRGIVTPEQVVTKISTAKDSGWNMLEGSQEKLENEETEYLPTTETLSGQGYGSSITNEPIGGNNKPKGTSV